MKKRPRVGLAIGSGAAYGLSAIGVLKVLEENEVPIDVISGTSIGSVIGALYASGMRSFRIEDELLGIEWKELLDFVMPKKGIVSGKKAEEYIRNTLGSKTFKELKIPLYIISVDINKGRQVVFHKGDVASAVRASISIPGVFTPVEMEGMTLVDGGVLNPIPTDVLKKHCDVIIAIDFSIDIKPSTYVSAKTEKSSLLKTIKHDLIIKELKYLEGYLKSGKLKLPFPFKWLFSPNYIYKMINKQDLHASSFKLLDVTKRSYNIMAREIARLRLELNKPDVLIHPDLSKMNWLEFDKSDYALKQGEKAAQEKIEEIKKFLEKKKR